MLQLPLVCGSGGAGPLFAAARPPDLPCLSEGRRPPEGDASSFTLAIIRRGGGGVALLAPMRPARWRWGFRAAVNQAVVIHIDDGGGGMAAVIQEAAGVGDVTGAVVAPRPIAARVVSGGPEPGHLVSTIVYDANARHSSLAQLLRAGAAGQHASSAPCTSSVLGSSTPSLAGREQEAGGHLLCASRSRRAGHRGCGGVSRALEEALRILCQRERGVRPRG